MALTTLPLKCACGQVRGNLALGSRCDSVHQRIGPRSGVHVAFGVDDLRSALPKTIGSGLLQVQIVADGIVEREGHLNVVLRLIVFDEADGQTAVRDIKEQEVRFVDPVHREEPERVRAYIQGWGSALATLLNSLPVAKLEGCMPSDLVEPSVLGLARADTPADFEAALLRKSRLGRLLD